MCSTRQFDLNYFVVCTVCYTGDADSSQDTDSLVIHIPKKLTQSENSRNELDFPTTAPLQTQSNQASTDSHNKSSKKKKKKKKKKLRDDDFSGSSTVIDDGSQVKIKLKLPK